MSVTADELLTSDGLYPRFSDAEFSQRHAAARKQMEQHDVDAIITYGHTFLHNEIQWMCNWETSWEGALVFPGEGDPTLFVHFYNHIPLARRLSIFPDIRWFGADLGQGIADALDEKRQRPRRIGVAGPITHERWCNIDAALPNVELVDFTAEMADLRLIKSDEEIAILQRAAELTDRTMQALEREVQPGMTEHKLTEIVQASYLEHGGRNLIHYMGSTPMRDPQVPVPAQWQSNRVLQKGDVLITEISTLYHGYWAQVLRPFTIGEPPTPKYQHIYDVAEEIFRRCCATIRPGATVEDVLDQVQYLHDQGYTIRDEIVHGFMGTWTPMVRTRDTNPKPHPPYTFVEGQTVVIQPAIVTEDDTRGVQVGEAVRVTATGVESFHHYPLRFTQIG